MTVWHVTITVFGSTDVVLRAVVVTHACNPVTYSHLLMVLALTGLHCSLNVRNHGCWVTLCMSDNLLSHLSLHGLCGSPRSFTSLDCAFFHALLPTVCLHDRYGVQHVDKTILLPRTLLNSFSSSDRFPTSF